MDEQSRVVDQQGRSGREAGRDKGLDPSQAKRKRTERSYQTTDGNQLAKGAFVESFPTGFTLGPTPGFGDYGQKWTMPMGGIKLVTFSF